MRHQYQHFGANSGGHRGPGQRTHFRRVQPERSGESREIVDPAIHHAVHIPHRHQLPRNRRIRQHQLVHHQRELPSARSMGTSLPTISAPCFRFWCGVLSTGPGSSGLSVMPNSLASFQHRHQLSRTPRTSPPRRRPEPAPAGSRRWMWSISAVRKAWQAWSRCTVSTAAIFLGFGYDDNLLLVTGNTTSFRNPGVPDFSITGNLTLSTMNITNVESPVGIANVTSRYSDHPDHRHLRGAALWHRIFSPSSTIRRPPIRPARAVYGLSMPARPALRCFIRSSRNSA